MDELDAQGMLRTVDVEAIRPNPYQPRSEFEDEALDELADSIREHGLIQPLIVHEESPGDYTLIAGERRWRACRRAGIEQVPVVVKEATPQEMLELALIENIQRADLNPLEEGLAYQQLMEDFGLKHEEIARRVGKSRSAVSNTLRLLDLPEKVRLSVLNGEISGGHARALCALATPEQQLAVMAQVVKNGWNVRKTEEIVRKLKAQARPARKKKRVASPEIQHLEWRFRESLGTRVQIEAGRKGGKVVIYYYSDEELNAIYDHIAGDDSASV
jgi:ParB family chromosome partitioning protein